MEENKKSGMTAEGRTLRPRRPRISSRTTETKAYSTSEHKTYEKNYGERRSYGSSEGGERRNYSDRRSYGSRNSYGSSERGGYGNSERSGYGSHDRSYGSYERRSQGDGERGERRAYGERRNFGYSEGGERRSYGERRSFGNRNSYGNSERGGYGNSERGGNNRPDRRSYGSSEGFEGGERGGYSDRRSTGGYGKPRHAGAGRPGFGGKPKFGGKPAPKGGKRPSAKKPRWVFTDETGINEMISKRPQVDQIELSDNDTVRTPIKEEIRLNKFIANSGVCSRREADQYIQAGVVTVNGEIVTELGTKINVLKDEIKFNGEKLRGEEKVYIVMNKPKGYVTTASDPHAEKTVMELMKDCAARVFPVGRLDKNTTGVLMFTNDGEIAEKLTHPSYDKKKIYQVILDKPLTEEDFAKVLSGVALSDGEIKADDLEYIDAEDHRKAGIEIHSGKNRIVRRIFESLGYDVKALDRVYFAGLTKKGLKKGEWRYLTDGEVNVLRMGAYV